MDDLSVDSLLERCNFPQENTVVDCAVSGGPDSLTLLILAVHQGLDVTAWHVDHGLREGSSAEGEKVAEAADRLGAKSNLVTVSITDGPNLEARARDARREALPKDVLTGHTADDQAETVLLNLLRGAGLPGTAGIGEPHRRPAQSSARLRRAALVGRGARAIRPRRARRSTGRRAVHGAGAHARAAA